MTEMRRVKHGPFMGYVSSVSKDLIPVNAAGPDSRDWRYNPTLGKWIERGGSAILGDTFGAIVGLTTPYLESTLRTRQIFEFPSITDEDGAVQFTDGYASYGALYDIQSSQVAVRTGWLYFNTTNGATVATKRQFPAKSWSATTYPLAGAKSFIKALPTWHQQADAGVTGRKNSRVGSGDTSCQPYVYGGGRRVLISGKWMYTVGEHVDSRRWNMLYNDSSSSPTRKERHWPMGILPVLFPAWIKAADFPTPNQTGDTWKEGDAFWMSACYVFEDGTWGPPFIPRALYGTQVAGGYNDNYGYVKLTSGVAGRTWQYIVWANIAQPPPGCTHTVLLRSTKVDSSSGQIAPLTDADGNLDLRIVAMIPKGTTSYKDYAGNDTALLVDSERVRSDHVSPPRARYIAGSEGRVFLGYTRMSPQLIYLAHTGTTNPNDNTDDDDATLGNAYFVRINRTDYTLRLMKAVTPFPDAAPTSNTIDMTGKTLQEIVDAINATTVSSTTDEWRAQLAPGVDGNLSYTAIMRFAHTGGEAINYGDNALTNPAQNGSMRTFAQGYPAVLQWEPEIYITREPSPDRDGIYFSRGAPESAAAGVTAAPNFWVAGNYRKPPEYSGPLMGFAPVEDGMVAFFTDKIWLIRNTRDFRSGRDEDFYMVQISNDGCIAWDSIVEFNNAVGWLSRKGYKVWGPDVGEQLISNAIYDPTEGVGDLAYEIGKCMASAPADTDDMRFHAHNFGSCLVIKFRSSASVTVPDLELEYDFSEGSQSGGARELFRNGDPNTPFGWSTPFRRPGEAMGHYRGSSGMVKLHAIETAGSTGSGRIDQLDTGYQDNGTAITPVLYTRMDDQGEIRRRKREQRFTMKYTSPTGHTMTVTHARDRNRGSTTSYTMDNTGTAEVAAQTKRIKLDGQTPARVSEYKISGTRVTAGAAEVWELERDVKVLDTPVETAG